MNPFRTPLSTLLIASFSATVAHGEILLSENFETPDVSTTSQAQYGVTYAKGSLPAGGRWIASSVDSGADRKGLINKVFGDYVAPTGNNQGFHAAHSNAGITSSVASISHSLELGVTYTVSFDVARDNNQTQSTYLMELVAFTPAEGDAVRADVRSATKPGMVLAFATGTVTKNDLSTRVRIVFQPDATIHAAHLGKKLGLRFIGHSSSPIIDNVSFTTVGGLITDSDADGMSDPWEIASFGNLSHTGAEDGDNDTLSDQFEYVANLDPNDSDSNDLGRLDWIGVYGYLSVEQWNGIPGETLADLRNSQEFYGQASSDDYTSRAKFSPNGVDNYGLRLSGTVIAPKSGDFRFSIAGGGECQLFLSTDSTPFNRRRIAAVSAPTAEEGWDEVAGQKSAPINLIAGQEYYIEVLYKGGTGADHVSVAWEYAGQARQVIPSPYLRSYVPSQLDLDGDGMLDSWESLVGLNPNDNGFTDRNQSDYLNIDGDAYLNFEEYAAAQNPLVSDTPSVQQGFCEWQLFTQSIIGSQVTALTKDLRFAQNLPASKGLYSTPESSTATGDYYGRRMRGILTIPSTGTYYFYVSGDEASTLLLNPAGPSRFGKSVVATCPRYVPLRNFTMFPSQKSIAYNLNQGDRLYFEVLQVDYTGFDHCSLAWSGPPSTTPQVVPSQSISTCESETTLVCGQPIMNDVDGDSLPDSWEVANGLLVTNSSANALLNGEYGDPDGDNVINFIEYKLGTNPLVKNSISGGLTMELWSNMSQYSTRELVASRRFYDPPQSISLTQSSSTGEQTTPTTYFATRMRGRLVAPATGPYRFWISGRNGVELYLSTDSTKYAKRRIAGINPELGTGTGIGYNDSILWDQFASQQSAVVYLVKDQEYFIETLQSNGHVAGAHVSLAWAPPGEGRAPIPAGRLRTYFTEAADADDDYLPDSWEIQYGLDALDNGRTDLARQGERGDYDKDGLTNREEYLLGTNPTVSDTDGDGESDGNEVNGLGSNPLVASSIMDTFLSEVALDSYVSSSTLWTMTSGGLLADSFRGEATWNFSTPSDGNWLFRLDLELMGITYGEEEVPIVIKVDGKTVIRKDVRFGSGRFGLLQALSPWLLAGNHQISVLVDNSLARRTVRLVSLKIFAPDNAALALSQGNRTLSHPASIRTSPAFIEGYARDAGSVTVNSVPAQIGTGDGHWYANVPLANVPTAQPYTLQYEQGWQDSGTITWQATNVMDGETLTIRCNDSLRVGAWGDDPAMTSTVTSSPGGTHALTGQETTTLTFPTAGVFTVTGTLQSGASATLTVNVIAPPSFSAATVDVLENVVRTLSVNAAPQVMFDTQDDLCRLSISRTTATASIGIIAAQPVELGVAARLFNDGPILSILRVNVIGISDAMQNDLTSTSSSGITGYKLLQTPLTALNLPSGARIDVSIFRAGVMFPNGTTLKSVYPSNFTNGSVMLQFLFPLGMAGGYCHNLLVYDRNGIYLGKR